MDVPPKDLPILICGFGCFAAFNDSDGAVRTVQVLRPVYLTQSCAGKFSLRMKISSRQFRATLCGYSCRGRLVANRENQGGLAI